MSYELINRPSTTVRHSSFTLTSGSGNFQDTGAGYALLEASGATFVTNKVRKGDKVVVFGTREVSRFVSNAATTYTGGESFKFYNGDDSRSYVLWFTKAGAGTAPVVTTETLLGPVNVLVGQSAATIGTNIRNALSALLTTNVNFAIDFVTIDGSTSTCNITNMVPGNCTNIAIFSGAGFGTASTPTAGVTLTSTNNDYYEVQAVVSETMLMLDRNWNSAGVAIDGTATIYVANNQLRAIDEATVTLETIRTGANNERIVEKIPIGSEPATPHVFTMYLLNLTSIDIIHTGSTHTDVNMTDAIVVSTVGATGGNSFTSISFSTAQPGTCDVNVGTIGSDPNYREFSDGCCLMNIQPGLNNSGQYNLAGSMVMFRPNQVLSGVNNKYIGSIWSGNISNLSGTLGNAIETINNMIYTGKNTNGFAMFGNPANSDNILLADTPAAGFLLGAGSFTVKNLALSTGSFTPVFDIVASSNPTILDPADDYTVDELFSNIGGTGTIAYTFNPRLVFRNAAYRTPLPIEGAFITITQIALARMLTVDTASAGSTYRTVIDGITVDSDGDADPLVVAANITADINASGLASVLTATDNGDNTISILPLDFESDFDITVSVIGGSGEYSVSDIVETDLGAFETDANGRIDIETLTKGVLAFGVTDYYHYSIVISGGGAQTKRYFYTPRAAFSDDIACDPVDHLARILSLTDPNFPLLYRP